MCIFGFKICVYFCMFELGLNKLCLINIGMTYKNSMLQSVKDDQVMNYSLNAEYHLIQCSKLKWNLWSSISFALFHFQNSRQWVYFVISLVQPCKTSASMGPYSMSSPSRVRCPPGVMGSSLKAVTGRVSTPGADKCFPLSNSFKMLDSCSLVTPLRIITWG